MSIILKTAFPSLAWLMAISVTAQLVFIEETLQCTNSSIDLFVVWLIVKTKCNLQELLGYA